MALTPEEEIELLELELSLEEEEAIPLSGAGGSWASPTVSGARTSYLPQINGRQIDTKQETPLRALPGMIVDSGLEGAGASLGQGVGALTGPFAPAAVPVLGSVGASIGNAAGQLRRNFTGEQKGFSVGQMAGAAAGGAIPGVSLAKAPLSAVRREVVKNATANTIGKAAEVAIDEKRLLSADEAVKAAVFAGIGAAGQKAFAGKGPKRDFNSIRDSRFADMRPEGVVVPPHAVDRGDFLSTLGGGRTAMEAEAAKRNAPKFGNMAREEAGMGKDVGSISLDDLNYAKQQTGQVYAKVQAIGDDAKERLAAINEEIQRAGPGMAAGEMVKSAKAQEITRLTALARADTATYKKAQDRVRDLQAALENPSDATQRQVIREQLLVAKDELEKLTQGMQEALTVAGQPELFKEFNDARVQYAKLSDIERSWTEATGATDANVLARMHDSDPEKLTGKLRKAAQFAGAFRDEARDSAIVAPPGVNKMTFNQAAQSAARNNFPGYVSAAVTMATKPVRNALYSEGFQNYLARPVKEGPGMRAAILKQMLAEQGRK